MPRLLPYMRIEEFLGETLSRELLAHAIASEERFKPSRVGTRVEEETIDVKSRVSLVMRDLGAFDAVLQARIRDVLPELLAGLRMAPFQPRDRIELELAAHGDGAFYKPHIDMRLGETADRVVSAVYYLHGTPKVFTGGGLRIFPAPKLAGDDLPVEIEPTHDSLLVFPSYVRHEVLRVSCPGAEFKDYRFAVNCWVYKAPT